MKRASCWGSVEHWEEIVVCSTKEKLCTDNYGGALTVYRWNHSPLCVCTVQSTMLMWKSVVQVGTNSTHQVPAFCLIWVCIRRVRLIISSLLFCPVSFTANTQHMYGWHWVCHGKMITKTEIPALMLQTGEMFKINPKGVVQKRWFMIFKNELSWCVLHRTKWIKSYHGQPMTWSESLESIVRLIFYRTVWRAGTSTATTNAIAMT